MSAKRPKLDLNIAQPRDLVALHRLEARLGQMIGVSASSPDVVRALTEERDAVRKVLAANPGNRKTTKQ